MKDVFSENRAYKCIRCMSTLFGTRMTVDSKGKQYKVMAYTTSLLWCLAIVANQIDYAMKPLTEEPKEKRKQDTTFEQIIRLDFWTYNAIYFLSCFLSLIGGRIQVNTATVKKPKNIACDLRWMSIVFLLVVGNLIPTFLSYYGGPGIQTKADTTYNLLFQDVCKLGILTVDLQFTWFCWSLEDGFSKLNDKLRLVVSLGDTPQSREDKAREGRRVATTRNNDNNNNYRYEIHRVNITYGQLMEGLKNVLNVCEERVLMNLACYMFNTICGIFNTISAYKTEGTPIAIIVVHLTRVINCAARISVMCCAASSVVDQDDRLHDLSQIAKGTSDTNSHYWETKQFLRRLAHSKVKFDVCGMITIDKTLLSSVVISVISYLVIVLQYNYS